MILSDDTRFNVSRDGVISATQPLQLQRREISFSVHAWDTAGKRHSARVTLRRWWQQQQQVKCSSSPWGHHRWDRACAGLSKVLALI